MKAQSVLIILTVLVTTSLRAQVVPGRWEKLDALQPGQQITVTLKSGDRIDADFQSSSPDEISLVTRSRRLLAALKIPKADVEQVSSLEADSRLNGTLIGAGVGAAFGLTGFATADSAKGPLIGSAITAGIGALIGLAIDIAHKRSEIVYKAKSEAVLLSAVFGSLYHPFTNT